MTAPNTIRFPIGPIVDASGYISLEWQQWLQNPQLITLSVNGAQVSAPSGGANGSGVAAFLGEDGEQGEQGIPGRQGDQGPQGLQGTPGHDGSDGDDGLTIVGPQGPAGAAGPMGAPGQEGADAEGVIQLGQYQSADPFVGSYSPGSFSVTAGKYALMSFQLQLNGSETARLEGNATLRIG